MMILASAFSIAIRRFRAFGAGQTGNGRANSVGRLPVSRDVLKATSPSAIGFYWVIAVKMH